MDLCEEKIEILEKKVRFLKSELEIYRKNYVTGLYGRRDFMIFLNRIFENRDFYLIYLDVNNLHKINREKGFSEGDAMLLHVSNRLIEHFPYDQIFHIGGDEFYIISFEDVDIECKLAESEKVFSRDFSSISRMLDEVDERLTNKKEIKNENRK